MRLFYLIIICFISNLLPCTVQADVQILRLGIINERKNEPDYMLKLYRDLVQQLNQGLQAQQLKIELVTVSDQTALIEQVRAGQLALIMESTFSGLKLKQEANMQPFLLGWRKGLREYHSVFFTKQDSDIQQINDLKGKTIAFESLRSTSAYALPTAYLTQAGFQILPQGTAINTQEAIQYLLAGDEQTQAYWVVLGKAQAGAFNNGDWQKLPETLRNKLRIFAQTPDILRWLVLLNENMAAAHKTVLTQAFLDLSNTTKGQAALKASLIDHFEALTETDFANLEKAEQLIQFIPEN